MWRLAIVLAVLRFGSALGGSSDSGGPLAGWTHAARSGRLATRRAALSAGPGRHARSACAPASPQPGEQATFEDVHRIVEPYAVYFPQFHAVPENDANFFPGFTDMVNLAEAKKRHPALLTPMADVLGFYDLRRDRGVIPRQIDLARRYGFRGFALYYYWFSTNSVTGKHMVFGDVVNRFFSTALPPGFDVFFVYCNEAWSNNVAFSSRPGRHNISNEYGEPQLETHMASLIPYFKHANYKKVRNRPVFFVHHPEEMADDALALLKRVGDRMTRAHGFDGLELVVDCRDRKRAGLPSYYLHSNYKTSKGNTFLTRNETQRTLDYSQYVSKFVRDEWQTLDGNGTVHSVFTNFDNTVRFFASTDLSRFVTRTVNNSILLFADFLSFQFQKYVPRREDDIGRIFLVNSWNEWGEQMVLEPSNEQGYLYLEVFKNMLLYAFRR